VLLQKIPGTQVNKENAKILGHLVCDLGEEYIRSSAGTLLKELSQCESFLPGQEEAIRSVISSSNTVFGYGFLLMLRRKHWPKTKALSCWDLSELQLSSLIIHLNNSLLLNFTLLHLNVFQLLSLAGILLKKYTVISVSPAVVTEAFSLVYFSLSKLLWDGPDEHRRALDAHQILASRKRSAPTCQTARCLINPWLYLRVIVQKGRIFFSPVSNALRSWHWIGNWFSHLKSVC